MKWFGLAATQGNARAHFFLGDGYAKGNGLPKDYVLAYMWSNLAAASAQFADSVSVVRNDVERKMTYRSKKPRDFHVPTKIRSCTTDQVGIEFSGVALRERRQCNTSTMPHGPQRTAVSLIA
jgi:hypothetical protein